MGVTRGGAGGILVRVETRDGVAKWRNVPDLRHRTLCSAFGLNDSITSFELPDSARDGGRARVGAGGSDRKRKIDGYVFQGPKGSEPVGKITIVEEGEKFSEYEERQWLKLG